MADLIQELQVLVVTALKLPRAPESISPTTRLFGGELGLDSVDAVGVILEVERRYSIEITDGDLARFPRATLEDMAALLAAKGTRSDRSPGGPDSGRMCGCRTQGQLDADGKYGA